MSNRKPITTQKPIQNAPTVFDVKMAEVKEPSFDVNKIRKSTNDWVFYGDNNLWPEFLIKCASVSETHSAFISLRENFIKGASISYSDNIQGFMQNIDTEETTIEELWSDWATDMSILETFAVKVRYNKTKTGIVALDYLDSSKIRPSKTFELDKDGDATTKISGYWYCEDWSNIREFTPVFFERFNPNNINETTQVHFYHKRANGQPWLPKVSYTSCLKHALTEDETGKFSHNSMLNGFFGSAILNVTASMTPEQKHNYVASVRTTFTGAENASKLMVNITEDKEANLSVVPLSTSDNTPMMVAVSAKAQQAIATAHRCDMSLAAISTSTGFNSEAAKLRTAQEAYQKNVIGHLQAPMISFIEKVLRFNKVTEYEFKVEPLNLVSEVTPDWLFQDVLNPELAATHYGFLKEDVRADLRTPEPGPGQPGIPASAPETADQLPPNPYPASVQ